MISSDDKTESMLYIANVDDEIQYIKTKTDLSNLLLKNKSSKIIAEITSLSSKIVNY